MSKKIKQCKTCGKEIASSAKTCPNCGAKNSNINGKKFFIILILFFVIIGIIGGTAKDSSTGDANETNKTVSNIEDDFSGDCGITADAEMGTDIIGQPTLNISIKNVSKKDISAIKFYAKPIDVYGDEINNVFSQNYLYTDDTIESGKTDTISYQFLDNEVKRVELYVYSVYFADGTEWGDRDAGKSKILEKSYKIDVAGLSEK